MVFLRWCYCGGARAKSRLWDSLSRMVLSSFVSSEKVFSTFRDGVVVMFLWWCCGRVLVYLLCW